MNGEVEEPFKKNGRTLFTLVVLMLILLITGVLLVSWYLGDIRQGTQTANLNRILISLFAVLTLMVLLIVLLVNFLRRQKKASRKRTPVKPTDYHSRTQRKTGKSRKPVSKRSV